MRSTACLLLSALVLLALSAALATTSTLPGAGPTRSQGGLLIFDQSANFQPSDDALPDLQPPPPHVPIRGCAALIHFFRQGLDLGEAIEQPGFRLYHVCLAQELIAHASAYDLNSFDPNRLGEQWLRHLDLAGIPNALAQRRPATHYRLTEFGFLRPKVRQKSLILKEKGFIYRLEALALGGFLNNGRAQVLIRFSEKASAGTYDSVALYVLDWSAAQDSITARSVVDLLRDSAPGSPIQ